MRRTKQPAWAPTYKQVSDALSRCLPLPKTVDVHLDLYSWQRLRDELGRVVKNRLRHLPFDECPIHLELWGSQVRVWPR